MRRRLSKRERVRSARWGRRAWVGPLALGLLATLTWSSPADADGTEPAARTASGPRAVPLRAVRSAATADTDLKKALDTILADRRLAGAAAGVVVADASTGAIRYEHRAADQLMPASNTKLITSAAAMDILGPGYRYRTEVLSDARRRGSVLEGDLYLRGTGDPNLLAKDYDRLAADLRAAGVTRVTGRLMADDTRFDDQRLGRSWAGDDESAYYSAQISALTVAPDTDYDAGTVIVRAAPGARAGDRPKITITPANGYVRVDNRATTGAKGTANTLGTERRHGGNTLTVSGSLPLGAAPTKEWVSVWEPTGYAAAVFRAALTAHGVRVDGTTRLGTATPSAAKPLAGHSSMPLKQLLVPFMKLSNNGHAEVLTKTIGYRTAGRGTWQAGLTAIGGFLKRSGAHPDGLRQVDGSGLSRMNTVPARELTTLLLSVRRQPWFADWYAALPVACDPDRMTGGTLRGRMCGTPAARNARAKTGSFTGASALSGYVTDKDGRQLVYSIVLNNFLAPSVKSIEDAIVVTLASSGTARTVAAHPQPAPFDRSTDASGAAGSGGAQDLECAWRKPVRC
ncbi:D-alanyl-D-alanine carboxypeptidase/D-alanyl-D-alanine endopeptidase [Streptomyces palmae]|uniref:D-alanyl-D-alanine carboxypeptidase/D-alanyl-D-alanine endopeptidase n=1 Tax=Streptomyces palmae TaxID=1701085 RepID=UPI001ADED5B9|nr:D-alanyl-D-alanine carboxypeptidase/D-alanyl-D-alanine-endopeptidase [Streptomyces palmae]